MKISKLLDRCYVPYSHKATVAVVESKSGEFFPGVRVENASFPLTISAIQSALFCCISEGYMQATLFVDESTTTKATVFWEKAYSLEIKPLNTRNDFPFFPVIRSEQSMKDALNSLLDHAVVSESAFPVAALLQTDQGFVSGVNIELKPWNRGLCAERIALAKAISYGAINYRAMYISTRKGEYGSPCGACRQVISEHLHHIPVYLFQPDETRTELFSSDLLPYNFQLSSL